MEIKLKFLTTLKCNCPYFNYCTGPVRQLHVTGVVPYKPRGFYFYFE
jgi:hypothetical protein